MNLDLVDLYSFGRDGGGTKGRVKAFLGRPIVYFFTRSCRSAAGYRQRSSWITCIARNSASAIAFQLTFHAVCTNFNYILDNRAYTFAYTATEYFMSFHAKPSLRDSHFRYDSHNYVVPYPHPCAIKPIPLFCHRNECSNGFHACIEK